MTDDLVKRLRERCILAGFSKKLVREAADRIEALTAERDIAVADLAALKRAIAAKGGNEHAPTQDAYDAACRALGEHRTRADKAEAERDRGLHDPDCHCDSAEAVEILARAILAQIDKPATGDA